MVLLDVLSRAKLLQSKADPCVYYKWTKNGLSMVDDLLSTGPKEDVTADKKTVMEHFKLDQLGELSKYTGCKVQHNKVEGWMRLTQLMILQSFGDEFDLTAHTVPKTPAAPGEVLEEGKNNHRLSLSKHRDYRKGVGKLLHVTKLTRPDLGDSTRELAQFGHAPTRVHYNAMILSMKYCVTMKDRGILLKPGTK